MNETLRNWWSRLSAWSSKYSPTQKRNIAIAATAVLVCVIAILWMLLRPHYVTIMTGLDDKSLGQVDQKLQELKIPDKIVGSSVEVPANQADTARVQLAMAGLPKSGYIGYSSISNSFGMTQDQFDIQVLDALQQSLNQTIESIDGIESAQVHIVMPEQQLFVAPEATGAKASVFVQLGPGVTLSSTQVAGIQQLVAHSVKGLAPNDVTVVDQNGVALSSTPSNASTTASGVASELAARQQLEQSLASQLSAGLSTIVGPGNAVVTVHANVTFDQVQSQSNVLQPAPGTTAGYPTSQQIIKKNSSSSSGQAGGVAGQSVSNPNLPSYAGTGLGGGNSTSSDSEVTTNYDYSRTQTTTVNDPMQIQGFTVGVLLNANDKALTPQVVSQIKSFVASTVGLKAGSGATNDITVATVPFTRAVAAGGAGIGPWLWPTLAAAAAAAGGLFLWWRRRRRANDVADEPASALINPLLDRPLTEDEQMQDELTQLANRKPEEFANLLRTWLASD